MRVLQASNCVDLLYRMCVMESDVYTLGGTNILNIVGNIVFQCRDTSINVGACPCVDQRFW